MLQNLEHGGPLGAMFFEHGGWTAVSETIDVVNGQGRTYKTVHLSRVDRVRRDLVLHVENRERPVFLEWCRVVA